MKAGDLELFWTAEDAKLPVTFFDAPLSHKKMHWQKSGSADMWKTKLQISGVLIGGLTVRSDIWMF